MKRPVGRPRLYSDEERKERRKAQYRAKRAQKLRYLKRWRARNPDYHKQYYARKKAERAAMEAMEGERGTGTG